MLDEISGNVHTSTGAMAVDELVFLVFGLFYLLICFGVFEDLYFVVDFEVKSDFLIS